MSSLIKKLKQIGILFAVGIFCISCSRVPSTITNPWKILTLPSEAIFSDLAFVGDSDRGWLVGTQATLFETTDGGETWTQQAIELNNEKVTLEAISFDGDEGWIVGQPSILLHTEECVSNYLHHPQYEAKSKVDR
ncbi:MAG: YCF48-related protein, partial [Cyanobacteria bacterium J06635_13]